MPRAPPFKEQIESWDIAMRDDPQVSPRTRRCYVNQAKRIFKYAKAHDWPLNAKKLEPSHYSEYYRSIQGLSSKTQAMYMSGFTALLTYAGNPNAKKCKINIRPERGEVFWLERPQVIRLLQTAPTPRCLAAEVLFTYTGIREMEARDLRMRSVTDNWVIVQAGKRRKARKIPVDKEFWDMLTPYLEWRDRYESQWGKQEHFLAHPQYTVWGKESGPLLPFLEQSISKMTKEHGMMLDPPIFHTNSHPFRRYFGRSLDENGCPIDEIREYYGHETTKQTMEYIGKRDSRSSDAMMKYRPKYLDEVRGRQVA